MFTASTYSQRRNRLKESVKTGIILFIGNDDLSFNYPSNIYSFRQDSSFLYYFGHKIQNLAGVIDCDNDKEYLFGDDVSIDDIIWTGPVPSIHSRAEEIGVKESGSLSDLYELIQKALSKQQKVHFLPPYRSEQKLWLSKLTHIEFDHVRSMASTKLIEAMVKQRSIKTEEEIVEIEKAIDTAYKMHTTMMRMASVGTYEYEIAGTMEGIALAGGGPVSFPIILTTHGEILHGHDHSNKLELGRMVVSDAGCETDMHYCSDITRSVPVGGKFNERQKAIYEVVLNANMTVMRYMKPGVPYADMHHLAYRIIAAGLKELGLMKGNIEDAVNEGAVGLFMPHGLGHMMGMDVHDMEGVGEDFVGYDNTHKRSSIFGFRSLRLGRKLEAGFVVTDEPGTYFIPELIDRWKAEKRCADFINYNELEKFKDFGGIRIEDDILITEHGCRILGKAIPKTVEEVEAVMAE